MYILLPQDRSFIDPLSSLLDNNTTYATSNDVSSPVVITNGLADDTERESDDQETENAKVTNASLSSLDSMGDISQEQGTNNIKIQNENYFEDWFTSTNDPSNIAPATTFSAPASQSTSVSCCIFVQNLSCRLHLDEKDHIQVSIKNLDIHSKIPVSPFVISFVFCHVIYRESSDRVIPLLLIPSVPVTLLCPNDKLSPMLEFSVKEHQNSGYNIYGSVQSCNLILDIEVILNLLQFAYRIYDS